jgi:hypothetical protein
MECGQFSAFPLTPTIMVSFGVLVSIVSCHGVIFFDELLICYCVLYMYFLNEVICIIKMYPSVSKGTFGSVWYMANRDLCFLTF